MKKTKFKFSFFINKAFEILCAFALIAIVMLFSFFGTRGEFALSNQDRKQYEKLMQLYKDGTAVRADSIFPGNWTEVCQSEELEHGYKVAAARLHIGVDKVKFINTTSNHTLHVDSDTWGLVFIYPPNKASFFKFASSQITAYGSCVNRNDAIFSVKDPVGGLNKVPELTMHTGTNSM